MQSAISKAFSRKAALITSLAFACLSTASAQAGGAVVLEIPAGTVTVTDNRVKVNGEPVYEGRSVDIHEFGEAGVLIEAFTGGAYCPFTYKLIHPETGALRTVRPGSDVDTAFGECLELQAVLPELNLILMSPENANEHARAFVWNGFKIVESVIAKSLDGVPLPGGGADVERWVGSYAFELARDPREQRRLQTILNQNELTEFNRVIGMGEPIERRGDFVVASGCWPGICEARWAVLALRVSDGAPFVRLSDGTMAAPDGEVPPDFLRNVNSIGQLP